MRLAIIAAVLVALGPSSLGHAHCFRVWKYPWAQHCHATALARDIRLPHVREAVLLLPSPRVRRDEDMPLPDLTFAPGPEPDAETRIRLFLLIKGREQ
jgi:hypothetical protein